MAISNKKNETFNWYILHKEFFTAANVCKQFTYSNARNATRDSFVLTLKVINSDLFKELYDL